MLYEKMNIRGSLITLAIAAMLVLNQAVAFGALAPTTRADSLSPKDLAKIHRSIINSPPTPPPGFSRPLAPPKGAKSLTSKTLPVPTSTWTYGCTATSAGMLFAYYDRNGYPNMYTGPCNGGVCPLTDVGQGDVPGSPISGSCSIIATESGFDGRFAAGHVDDYYITYDSADPDPWVGLRSEHAWEGCTADFLGTNQWKWDYEFDGTVDSNTDGATTVFSSNSGGKLYDFAPPAYYGTPQTEACHGLRLFAESRGYSVLENYTQNIDTLYSGGFTFAQYVAEIDAGFPLLLQLEGHTMVGVGYDLTGSTLYVNDTWDNAVHTMTWGGSYSGMAHLGVTVIHLAGTTPGSVHVTLEPAEAVAAGAQWKLDSGAWQDNGATLASVPGGMHTVSFKSVTGWNTPASSMVNVDGSKIAEVAASYYHICDGVDACDRTWTSTGDANWLVQNTFSHDGTDAAQSGVIGDSQSSILSTDVTGPATVRFWWSVDSEADYDFLTFYIDGVKTDSISGLVDWTQKSYWVGAGLHTLTWTYAKDEGSSDGADAGRVDQFQVLTDTTPPTGTVTINANRSATNSRNVSLGLTWDDGADGSGAVRMRFSDDGAHWTAWEALAATRPYTLPVGADGHRTVRVQFLDKANNRSATFSDFIRLDTTPPTGSIIINAGASTTTGTAVSLGLTWNDGAGAQVSRMRFSNDGAHWTAWVVPQTPYAHTLAGTAGYNTVRVQYLDGAGNYSLVYNDYIKLLLP